MSRGVAFHRGEQKRIEESSLVFFGFLSRVFFVFCFCVLFLAPAVGILCCSWFHFLPMERMDIIIYGGVCFIRALLS